MDQKKFRIFDIDPLFHAVEIIAVGLVIYFFIFLLGIQLVPSFWSSTVDTIIKIILFGAVLYLIAFALMYHIGWLTVSSSGYVTVKMPAYKKEVKGEACKIWWNYIYGSKASDTLSKKKEPTANRISVWLLIKDTEGNEILLNNRLPPWREIPEHIGYSSDMEEYSNKVADDLIYLKTYSDLRKIKAAIEK